MVRRQIAGGGTLHLLRRNLMLALNNNLQVQIRDPYDVGSCCTHNIQTALRNGILLVYGDGGTIEDDANGKTHKMNAVQLLHGIYHIKNYLPSL